MYFTDDEYAEIKKWMFSWLAKHAVSEKLYQKLMHPEKFDNGDGIE